MPEYNIAIECQGEQHYSKKSFFPYKDEESLKKQISLDLLKKEKCEKNGVNIIYFTDSKKKIFSENISVYNEKNTFDKIEEIWELLKW